MLWDRDEITKNYITNNLKAPDLSTYYDRTKRTGECGIFKLRGAFKF